MREPPQDTETVAASKTIEVPEVILEPPQIDLTSAQRIFIDGAKIRLGAGVVLKSQREQCLNTASD